MDMTERGRVRASGLCVLLMALLLLPLHTSGQNTSTTSINPSSTQQTQAVPPGYNTVPGNLTVAVGEAATFRCGVSPIPSKPTLNLTLYSSHGNYSLTCPGEPVDDIPQALHGSCKEDNGELLALWTITGTSYSDNSTWVVCQQPGHPNQAAFLRVYESGSNYSIIIGCVIGGFFGILLVFYLAYLMVQRSETLQRWFGGSGSEEDDIVTIVTKEE